MNSFDLSSIKALVVDMDGVLWQGSQPIGDLPDIFERIAQRGWKVVLATNNATRTPEHYLDRLRQLDVAALEPWQIVSSAQAAALYLSRRYPEGGRVYVIGEEGLVRALSERGFSAAEEGVLAVVAGMDWQLTYARLRRATLLIRAGALFVGTNPDRTFPTPEGLVPGTGAILAALEAATSVSPIIVGKPASTLYELALERLGLRPEEILAIGDRPETDMAGAQAIGCRTALVLSGVTNREQAEAWRPAPDIIAADLASVMG